MGRAPADHPWSQGLSQVPFIKRQTPRHHPTNPRRFQTHLKQIPSDNQTKLLTYYGVALWAMTQASIALVVLLRETSVILGVLIAAVFLKEHISPLRYLSTLAVTAGAIAIKMS